MQGKTALMTRGRDPAPEVTRTCLLKFAVIQSQSLRLRPHQIGLALRPVRGFGSDDGRPDDVDGRAVVRDERPVRALPADTRFLAPANWYFSSRGRSRPMRPHLCESAAVWLVERSAV
jgi:hypothetical protein